MLLFLFCLFFGLVEATPVGVLIVCVRKGNNAGSHHLTKVPLVDSLSLVAPKDPAGTLVISLHLGLDVLAVLGDLLLAPSGNGFLAVARANVVRAGEGAVISGAGANTIEPLGTVGKSCSPFTDNAPEGFCLGLVTKLAGSTNVGRKITGNLWGRENLIVVVVKNNKVIFGKSHPVVPVVEGLESVVNNNTTGVGVVTNSAVAREVKLLDFVHVEFRAEGLVDKFNGSDNVVVFVRAVFLSHVVEDFDSDSCVVVFLPIENVSFARVVETVLGTWSTVEIDPYLEAGVTGPANGLVKISFSTLNIGVAGKELEGPVADGDSDVVELVLLSNVQKVLFSVPGRPMLLESAGGQFWAKPLGEVVFVDGDVSFVSAKGFKKRRGDVRF